MKKNRQIFRRGGCFLLCIFLLISLLPVSIFASEKTVTDGETIRVGWYEDSYHIAGANGERSGYGYEYEQSVAGYTGWTMNLLSQVEDQGIKYANENKLYSVFLMQPCNAAFAVTRGNAMLLSILNKTLKAMSSSSLTGALSMYDNAADKVTIVDFIKDNLAVAATVFATIFIVILLVVLSFLRKAREAEAKAKQAARQAKELNRKLQESHQELETALLRAESANSADRAKCRDYLDKIKNPVAFCYPW